MAKQWPLTGRDAEFALILDHLRDRRGGVVLAGPTGVGKTRLAADCLVAAEAEGFTVLRIGATSAASGLPFGCFAPLLPDLEPGIDRVETLRRVVRAIVSRGANGPVALFVDDAHLLDDTSAVLTHQLCASGVVFVLASVRSGELAPDPIVSMWKDGLATRVDVKELTHQQIGELLTAGMQAPVSISTQRLLGQRSGGNVMVLRELVLSAIEVGALRKLDGVWHLPANLAVSSRLVELVETRLSGLPVAGREGLELVALGEPLALELFVNVAGEDVLGILDKHQLIRIERAEHGPQVRLAHPAYGEILRTALPQTRSRLLYSKLGKALYESGAHGHDDILRLATWRLRAGRKTDPQMMLAAARRAWALHDAQLSEELVESAIESGPDFDSELLLGTILSVTGRAAKAEERLSRLGKLVSTEQQRAALTCIRVNNLAYCLGRVGDAIAVAKDAERSITDPAHREEVTAHRAAALMLGGRSAEAVDALSVLLETGGPARGWACRVAGYTASARGQISEAVAFAERGHAAHLQAAQNPGATGVFDPIVHTAVQVLALSYSGDLAEAESLATAAYERGVADSSVEAQISMASPLCINAVLQGRIATAIRWGRESVTLAAAQGRRVLLRVALGHLAEALALAGQVQEAEHALSEIDALATPSVHFMQGDLLRARAWTAAARGAAADAQSFLRDASQIAVATGNFVVATAAEHDLVRLGCDERAANCADLASRVEGPLSRTRAAHALALAADDGGDLLSVSQAFESLGANLLAAESSADAAAAFKGRAMDRAAVAANRRAGQLLGSCEGGRTPGRKVTVDVRGVLTKRQSEIAALAAAGHSNRDIAGRLHVSVRTVENKLYSVYQQLGVKGRFDLAEALDQS